MCLPPALVRAAVRTRRPAFVKGVRERLLCVSVCVGRSLTPQCYSNTVCRSGAWTARVSQA